MGMEQQPDEREPTQREPTLSERADAHVASVKAMRERNAKRSAKIEVHLARLGALARGERLPPLDEDQLREQIDRRFDKESASDG